MSTLLAQVEFAPAGLSPSLFLPLFAAAVLYAVLVVAGTVLENREASAGPALTDASFALMLLMAGYTLVLVVVAVAQRYVLVGRMLEVLLVVVLFFAILLVALFLGGQLVGVIGRLARRDRRVTTDSGE